MKKFALPIFLTSCVTVLFAGCATDNYYAQTVSSWKGATMKKLFARWGYPGRIARLPKGRQMLIYRKTQMHQLPAYAAPGHVGATVQGGKPVVTRVRGTVVGGDSYDRTCMTWLEVGKKGRIINTRFRGSDCYASQSFMQKYSNPEK